jgi:hypothetical protein
VVATAGNPREEDSPLALKISIVPTVAEENGRQFSGALMRGPHEFVE